MNVRSTEDVVREVAAKAGFPRIDDEDIVPNLIRLCIGAGYEAGIAESAKVLTGDLDELCDRMAAAVSSHHALPYEYPEEKVLRAHEDQQAITNDYSELKRKLDFSTSAHVARRNWIRGILDEWLGKLYPEAK